MALLGVTDAVIFRGQFDLSIYPSHRNQACDGVNFSSGTIPSICPRRPIDLLPILSSFPTCIIHSTLLHRPHCNTEFCLYSVRSHSNRSNTFRISRPQTTYMYYTTPFFDYLGLKFFEFPFSSSIPFPRIMIDIHDSIFCSHTRLCIHVVRPLYLMYPQPHTIHLPKVCRLDLK